MLDRDELAAIWRVARYRPLLATVIVVFGVVMASLEGLGLSFILPIVEFARSPGVNPDSVGGPMSMFADAYGVIGIPFTLDYVIAGAILVMGLRYGASVAMEWLHIRLQADYDRTIKSEAFDLTLNASIHYFDERGSDEILNVIITEASQASSLISVILNLLQQSLLALMYLGVALYFAPVLTVLTLIGFGGVSAVVRYGVEPGQAIGTRMAVANEEVQSAVQAGTQGIRDARLFGMLDTIRDRFSKAMDKRIAAMIRQKRNQALIQNVYEYVSAIALFVLIFVALELTSLSLGALGVFLFAMFRVAPRISTLNSLVYRVENLVPHLQRTQEFRDELEDFQEPDTGDLAPPEPVTQIEFENVSFAYEPNNQVLSNVSLSVTRDEFVAFVGKSGAGKSTIASLLARLYVPDSGRILADGTPISDIDARQWRSKLAVVRQNPFIFNESLRYNLTIGNQDVSQSDIERICDIAQVTEFLDELPNGYETQVGDDGVMLSGGQRQRVALARALLKDADVLLLDEATSDLDSEIERRVQDTIESMDRDYILITIAHRLSTVKNADRIYTIEDGEIIEEGSHDDLIRNQGRYAELYARQS